MKILVCDTSITGHHLEYLHHLFQMAVNHPEHDYVFVVPKSFLHIKNKMEWEMSSNVVFDYVEDNQIPNSGNDVFSLLLFSLKICLLIRRYSQKHKAKFVFSNSIMNYVPFAILFLRNVRISGIVYKIFIHNYSQMSLRQKIMNKSKYAVMSWSGVFSKILLLNDYESAQILNQLFHTQKFMGLPDPFVPLPLDDIEDFRKRNNIPSEKKIFVHFGGLTERKGTIDILESLNLLSESELEDFYFVFAGKVYDSIREKFYDLVEKNRKRVGIYVKDEFCEFSFLASICHSCDAIICPYHETDLSSGMLGYASQFGKPVIAPKKGLIGKLVKESGLGYLMNEVSEQELVKGYRMISSGKVCNPTQSYCKKNSVERFISKVNDSLLEK